MHLDETDSGLDVDAMKLVAEGVNALRQRGAVFWSSRTTNGFWTTLNRTLCTSWRMVAL